MKFLNVKINIADVLATWVQTNASVAEVRNDFGWVIYYESDMEISSVTIDSSKWYPTFDGETLTLPHESQSEETVFATYYSGGSPCVLFAKKGENAFERGDILPEWTNFSDVSSSNSLVLSTSSPEQGSIMGPVLMSLGYIRFPQNRENVEEALEMLTPTFGHVDFRGRIKFTDENGEEHNLMAMSNNVESLSSPIPDSLSDVSEITWKRGTDLSIKRRIKSPYDSGYGEGLIDELTYPIQNSEGAVSYNAENSRYGIIAVELATMKAYAMYSDIQGNGGSCLDYDTENIILVTVNPLKEPESDPDPDPVPDESQ